MYQVVLENKTLSKSNDYLEAWAHYLDAISEYPERTIQLVDAYHNEIIDDTEF